ncbi:hypothetical protein ACU635_38070 [[Actinomadura] parvosata]|uniref:hypothetical protein n=1 Tax=[Actinomadura] parvosata TaxID=1955412 RepID=UPI00406CF492
MGERPQPPPVGAFVVRIKAGSVARQGRANWLLWGLGACLALVIWSLARPWFVTTPQESGGSAVLGAVAYVVIGLAVVALLLASHAAWMFAFELVRPRYLRISTEGVELARGLRHVRFAWPRIASVAIVPGAGRKAHATLVLRPVFDFTGPDPFEGQRLSWTAARSPWRDKATDTIGLCRLDELNTTPGRLDAALRHFSPRPVTPGPDGPGTPGRRGG